ncbi:MAG: hypothetical protein WDW38_010000 [Sanguina aurantia]
MALSNALIVDVLQEATCINQAYSGCFVDGLHSKEDADSGSSDCSVQLLVNAVDHLDIYNVDGDGALRLHHTVHLFDRVEHILLLTPEKRNIAQIQPSSDLSTHRPSTHLLAFSSGASVSLLELRRDGACATLATADMAPNANPATGPIPRRMQGVCVSPPHMLTAPHSRPIHPRPQQPAHLSHQSSTTWLVAAAVLHDHIHFVTVRLGEATGTGPSLAKLSVFGVWLKATQLYGTIADHGANPLTPLASSTHVLDLAFLPRACSGLSMSASGSGSGGGSSSTHQRPLLAVLHQRVGSGAAESVNLDCMEVDLTGGKLLSGPFACRNMHPTTTLLQPFPGETPPLLLSSPSFLLKPLNLSSSATATAGPGGPSAASAVGGPYSPQGGRDPAVQKLDLVGFRLEGHPTCLHPLSLQEGRYALADSAAAPPATAQPSPAWGLLQPAAIKSLGQAQDAIMLKDENGERMYGCSDR